MTVMTALPAATPDPRPASGPELLTRAAVLLPGVANASEVTATDIHIALHRAAVQLRGCHATVVHQLAEEAGEMLVDYLAGLHGLTQASPTEQRDAVRAWAYRRNLGAVCFALRAAAEHWRAELILATLAPAGR